MSDSQSKKIAAQYLKEQAEIIARYGKAPKLSGESYREAESDAAKTFKTLSDSKKQKPTKLQT